MHFLTWKSPDLYNTRWHHDETKQLFTTCQPGDVIPALLVGCSQHWHYYVHTVLLLLVQELEWKSCVISAATSDLTFIFIKCVRQELQELQGCRALAHSAAAPGWYVITFYVFHKYMILRYWVEGILTHLSGLPTHFKLNKRFIPVSNPWMWIQSLCNSWINN